MSVSSAARFPAAWTGCRARLLALFAGALQAHAIISSSNSDTHDHTPAGNLQGLRHPRHRRQNADRRPSSKPSAAPSAPKRARAAAPTSCIGRDGRLSGPDLSAALARGLRAAGVNVIDVGRVATPMLYFAAHQFDTLSGVMVTGSHNPPRLQRPQDHARRRNAVGRRNPGAARARRGRTTCQRHRQLPPSRHRRGLSRAHRRPTSSSRGR